MDEALFSRSITGLVSDIIWEVDNNWIFKDISGDIEKYGFCADDLIGKKPCNFMPSDGAAELSDQLHSIALSGKNITDLDTCFITGQGVNIFFQIYGIPVADENNKLQGYRGIAKNKSGKADDSAHFRIYTPDINESINMAGKHSLNEKRFRNMFESAPQGIAIADGKGFIIHANRAWKKMFGFTDSDLKQLYMNDFRADENKQHDVQLYDSLVNNKIKLYRIERLFRAKDNHTFWCDLTAKLIEDPELQEPYAIGLYIDITDRKIIEDDLRSSEEFTRILINESPFGIGAISDEKLIFANNALALMFGFNDPSDMTGLNISSLVVKKHAAELLNKNNDSRIRNNTIFEIKAVKKNGVKFTISCKFELLTIKNSPVLVVFTEDITDRKRNEDKLKKFQKGLEKLVEERTDEIRKLNRQVFKTQEDERQRISRDLHDGVGQTILAAKLAFNSSIRAKSGDKIKLLNHGMMLMDMASQELREVYTGLYPSILSELGLGDTINWFIRNSLHANGIKVEYNNRIINSVPRSISINIYRIIQELFNNIIKHSHADFVEITLKDKPDFIIAITDNGMGFDYEKIRRKGRGAGLINIKQRVEYMDGKLYISSNPGSTSFIIIIPGENR